MADPIKIKPLVILMIMEALGGVTSKLLGTESSQHKGFQVNPKSLLKGTMKQIAVLKRKVRSLSPIWIVRICYRVLAIIYIFRIDERIDFRKKTIIAINHFYDQDLLALKLANQDYNFIVIDGPILFKGAKAFFCDDVIKIRAPYDSESQRSRYLYRGECRIIFRCLARLFDPALIVVPNDNFYWVREFIEVARENNVSTVIIDKEGIISPHSFNAEARRARECTPLVADHVFVWSERQKSYWEKRNVKSDQITIVGQPRSDLFFSQQSNRVEALFDKAQPLVTLYSFFDTAYIPGDYVKRGLTWLEMKRALHDEFAAMASKFPHYNFVVKCHPQQQEIQYLRDRYTRKNLKVIGGASDSNELIQRSQLIVAFQTTAVIEAMFCHKNLVYPAWDEGLLELKDYLLPFHEADGIVVANSIEQFRSVCDEYLSGSNSIFSFSREQIVRRDAFVERYLYKPDGNASSRFFEAVSRFIR